MEGNLVSRRKRLKAQVPDIKSSLAMVKKLREKKSAAESMETQFMLSDQVSRKTNHYIFIIGRHLRFMPRQQFPPQTRSACGSGLT